MVSEVSICNQALAHIGAEALIESLSENTEEARYCNIYYEPTRDSLLRSHAFNFATLYVALAKIGTAPTRWSYQYAYPADALTAIEIVNTADATKIDFEIIYDGASSRLLCTNQDDAELRYTTKVTDPTVFDPGFIEILSWGLAYRIAEPLTGSSDKKGEAIKIYQGIYSAYTGIDADEGIEDPTADPSWITARA
jgi:hypothetical protein